MRHISVLCRSSTENSRWSCYPLQVEVQFANLLQMREWNRIKVGDGPGAGWQGEGEGWQGVGERGADETGEENGSTIDNMLTFTVQVQP